MQLHLNRYYFPAKRASAGPKHAEVVPSAGGPALTPEQVGQAVVDLTGPGWDQDAYLITGAGLRPLP